MSIKTGKKIGFFVALTMLLGSVVGIGIFFKNGSVLGAAHNNGSTALLAWIVGGLLSLAAALSFTEIGSLKTKNVHGLAAWAEITGGKKFGYFTRFNYSFFYFGILTTALGIFSAEAALMVLHEAGAITTFPHVGYVVLIGVAVSLLALTINVVSVKLAGHVQVATTVLKFIPLLLALVIGVVLPNTHNAGGSNHFNNGTDFSVEGLIAGLPAVLFAYDSFLNVGSLSGKTKGGEKTVSKVVIFGMLAVVILYSLVAISAILHTGSIGGLLADSLPKDAAKALSILIWSFILISAYGVTNGIIAAGVSNFEHSVRSNTFFGAKTLKAKWGEFKTTIFYLGFTFIFWALIILLPAALQNSDAIVDGATNYPTLFFFAIYAVVILLYFIKRNKLETRKINNILFKISTYTALIGISLVLGWQFFFTQTLDVFKDAHTNVSWGFVLDNVKFTKIEQFAFFASMLFAFGVFPYVNKWLTKKFENNDVIINTQQD